MTATPKPAYFMVQINFKDFDESMQRYGQFAMPMIAEFGGEMIAGSAMPKTLEGNWSGNWAAILRFPSMEMAEAWYGSEEYKPLKDLRMNELTDAGRVLLL